MASTLQANGFEKGRGLERPFTARDTKVVCHGQAALENLASKTEL
jgi:hypothetical protein